jgi:phosphatidylglycerophosphate synthase
VLSLFCDGIDGSLAMISEKSSTRGAMIDSIVDRLSEVFWALTFYRLGADFRLIALAWVLAFTQEYLRARGAGLGEREIGAVTIAERPVRASLLFIALIGYLLGFELVNILAAIWASMQLNAFVHLSRVFFKRLK